MKQNRNRFIDIENIFGRQIGGGVEPRGEKVMGLNSMNWSLQNTHGDIKYSIENTVNNILITVWCHMGTRLIGIIT